MLEIYHIEPEKTNLPDVSDFINSIENYQIITNDCDLYDTVTGNLVAKFRKNKLQEKKSIEKFVDATRVLARRRKENRGASAGKIDRSKLRETVCELYNTHDYRTYYVKKDGSKSKTNICNLAKSNVLGYINTMPRANFKLSGTHLSKYCIDYPDRWEASIPLIENMSDIFQEIDTEKWKVLDDNINDDYRIGKSAFSTVTINSSWQSACHRDANNGKDMFACMAVIEDHENHNNYDGGFFCLPEFKIAFDARHGDVLICNTQQYLHGNSPLVPKEPSKIVGKYSAQDITNGWYFNRLSIVAYIKKQCLSKTN